MRIALVDDVKADSDKLYEYLKRYEQERFLSMVVEDFPSGEQFLESFQRGKYDLIFLDIYMTGMSGMELARKLRRVDADFVLIFTTTSQDFAIQGYAVHASSYLLKPFDYSRFEEAMDLCRPVLASRSKFIEVKEKRYYTKILLKDIIYTDYDNHYIQIHTPDRIIRSYMPFKAFAPMLLEHEQFLCCYRNCIINMDKVVELDDKDFILENQERVPMRRPDKQELRQRYADYIFKKMNGDAGF